ncbi:hypothetical protein AHAS_Ahas12G0193800 [Arachis hypogaea]
MVLSQKIHEAFKGTVERITSARTVSAFKEKGVLSVSEFVIAGDNLVAKCPTWSCYIGSVPVTKGLGSYGTFGDDLNHESNEPSKRKPYLPADKQFLITRNVPCLRRVASVEEEYEVVGGEVLLDDEENDGWLATHGKPKETKSDEKEDLPSMESLEISKKEPIKQISFYMGGDEEDDIPDMVEFEETDNIVTDPSTYLVAHESDDDNILRTRTYDSMMILQQELVVEDVSQDHARKTVTIEDHPHLPCKHASIHPCRHGAMMKKIIVVLMSRGVEPKVDKYMFLFLKFMASVIPTIEYDYTMDFDLGSSRNN